MAARKPAAKPAPEAEEATEVAEVDAVAAEMVARGGWDVGYVGDRTDPEPNESYTVAGVTAAAPDADGD